MGHRTRREEVQALTQTPPVSAKIVRCFVNPYADPWRDSPAYHITLHDAEGRVNGLGCCYWVDQRTIQYHDREERNREELIAAGTFREAWQQVPSGPTRIPVMQMPRTKTLAV